MYEGCQEDAGAPLTGRTRSAEPAEPGAGSITAPRLAHALVALVIAYHYLATTLEITADGARTAAPDAETATALLLAAVSAALTLLHTTAYRTRGPRWAKAATLGVQALMTCAPLLAFGSDWEPGGALLGASVLLLVPGAAGWLVQGATALGLSALAVAGHHPPAAVLGFALSTWAGGLVVFGVVRLADAVAALAEDGAALARRAVVDERLRFSRDLHDLLGFSLSAVILKTELIRKLIRLRPEQAETEADDILTMSRQAIGDLRGLASGYRRLSLAEECESARRVLQAARIHTSVTVGAPNAPLPPTVETALATVLREGVTNVLRHSKARTCSIAVAYLPSGTAGAAGAQTVSLSVVNDGAARTVPTTVTDRSIGTSGTDCGSRTGTGTGLTSLTHRMADVAGSLSAGVDAAGRFHLVAHAPGGPGVPGGPTW